MAALWDEIWKKASGFSPISWYAEEFLQYLIKWSLTQESALFLEPGAGSGRFSYRLSQRGCEVVALDISRNSISLLQKLKNMSKGFMHVIRADIRHMPFRDCVFDVVYNEGVVEHFQEPFCVLYEMARVLQRLGILIFSVPNIFSFHTPARFVATKLDYYIAAGCRFYGFERSFSKSEVRSLLSLLKLENVQVHGIGLLYGVGRYMPRALRALLHYISIRTRKTKLGAVLAEKFGFQVIGKGEKQGVQILNSS